MSIRKAGEVFAGEDKPKRTPNHPTKSHAVVHAGKLIRFGEKGAKTAGKPKSGESNKMKKILPKVNLVLLIGRTKSSGNG